MVPDQSTGVSRVVRSEHCYAYSIAGRCVGLGLSLLAVRDTVSNSFGAGMPVTSNSASVGE